MIIQYFAQNKIDEAFIKQSIALIDTDIAKLEQN
jgi:hypothetical protein